MGEEWLFGPPAHLKFPDLGRPATPDDVAQLRAIFTLAGEGETRTVRLRERPLRVSWIALKDKPVRYLASRADTGETVPGDLTWDQQGWVWQAEEVLKDGKWRRWYGFVGPHALAKLPAEEVRLPGGPLTKEGFAANLDMAGLTDQQSGAVFPEALAKMLPGMPLRAVCRITNCSGIDRAAPAEFYRKDPRTGPALLAGFDVKVLYVPPEKAEDSGVEDIVFCETPETEIGGDLPWQRLPCKVTARFKAEGPGRMLAMGEEFKTGEIDLTELFDLTRPGLYAVQFVFTAKDGAFTDGISDCIVFRLPAPGPQKAP